MTNSLEVRKNNDVSLNGGVFNDISQFEAAQRMAKALQSSNMVPANFKNDMGSCLIALDMASRLNMNVLAVMQNMYVVHGKPAWSSQFIISSINQSGLFASSLNFDFVGKENTDSYGCYAWALDKSTKKKIKGTTITLGMAKKEGWYDKKGSKWKTMPEQMLRYRAASFFGRTYAPDVTMGIYTKDEVEDTPDSEQYEVIENDREFEEAKDKEANSLELDIEDGEFEEVKEGDSKEDEKKEDKEVPDNVDKDNREIVEDEEVEGQSDFFDDDFEELTEAPY